MISNVQIVWKSLRNALNFRSILYNHVLVHCLSLCGEMLMGDNWEAFIQMQKKGIGEITLMTFIRAPYIETADEQVQSARPCRSKAELWQCSTFS